MCIGLECGVWEEEYGEFPEYGYACMGFDEEKCVFCYGVTSIWDLSLKEYLMRGFGDGCGGYLCGFGSDLQQLSINL